MTKNVACAALAAVLAAAPLSAQVPLSSRALGMGGAYIGVARGQESLYQNPANLGLPNSPHWSVSFPTLALGAQSVGVTPGQVWDLVNYNDLDDAERQEILDDIPSDGTGVEGYLRAPLISMQIRRLAFGVTYGIQGEHSINKSLVDLVLNGFDQSKLAQYNIQNTAGSRASFWDFHAGYGTRVGPLALGATGHYFLPRDRVRSAFVNQRTVFNNAVPTDVEVTYAGLQAKGGNGYGLDLGAAMEPIPGLTLGVAVDNVVNTMKWNDDNMRIRSVTLNSADYDDGDPEAILARYEDSETEFDLDATTVSPAINALAQSLRGDLELAMPTTLRVGGAYVLPTRTTIGASYTSELGDASPVSALWRNQLSLGVQQKLPIITLRAGVATDGESGNMLSGGVSLGPIQFGIARLHTGKDNDERNGWVSTISLSGRADTTMP
ncbi:DUF5723 family protein [Longimicrobium terrae]|uniref:DUF5723 domain-containing protein n=1 Tax=Longimicrobium terrae TaxID=1639882 RepID=A0A841GRB4_9BACT|nr:DUF5723 family protein [Longimicrobium terrae]MBB4635738.1 hypothetical protein [Longimicrobium terrae]MBB6070132.1 hypothetical protein [Longimicrobium terrae]NNC33033.1 hypothetical protein [Longimicrobium terrae]